MNLTECYPKPSKKLQFGKVTMIALSISEKICSRKTTSHSERSIMDVIQVSHGF